MLEEVVTLEKAIDSIKTAANEIPVGEFISYSTILDVHLTHGLEAFSPEDQFKLLEAVGEILRTHEDLARDIAWDLVSVLLPFLESSFDKTVSIAESLISTAASNGNPREVFIKLLEALSQIVWRHDKFDEESDQHSGDEDILPKNTAIEKHAVQKLHVLVLALETVHPRIATKFPSRFLSTELSTLLGTFIKAVETVDSNAATEILHRLVEFVKVAHPKLAIGSKMKSGERPPLPPRVNTSDILKGVSATENTSEDSSPESVLQARLIASFLSHALATYLLRTKRQPRTYQDLLVHEDTDLGLSNSDARGLEIGWTGKYDEDFLRPGKSKVPGGRTQIDEERAARSAQQGVREIVDEISSMCEALGVETTELLEICNSSTNILGDDDEDGIPIPKVVSTVPISKEGSLLLLANRLSKDPTRIPVIHVFPDHQKISEEFMIYGTGQTHRAVIDAILFLGALILNTYGIGSVPDEIELFTVYLQIFAVISTKADSPQARFLAHHHVSTCLRAHPNDSLKLAYIKDTLQHCPFESLKAATVGILKDEILHATSPMTIESSSKSNAPMSIFGTPLCLSEIFTVLFPDLESLFGDSSDDKALETFKELYIRLLAIVNLYIFMLLGNSIRDRLGVSDTKFSERVGSQFLDPLKRRLDMFSKKTQLDGGSAVEILQTALERIEQLKQAL